MNAYNEALTWEESECILERVASLAQPSQVLVSRTVTDLVAGSGLEFADRGEHDLKGVPGCWNLFSVEA